MNSVFAILAVQALLGGFDNLWHHELHANLPQRRSARRELALHAAREAIYGVGFLALAWTEWHGALALLLGAMLGAEVVITLADFLEEDRSRRLPPFERVLHTVLALTYGLFLAALAPHLVDWLRQPTAIAWAPHGIVSVVFSACAAGLVAWSARNALAVRALRHASEPMAPRHHDRILPAVLVTGATGFIGSALVEQLRRDGRRVIVLARDLLLARGLFGNGVWVVDRLDDIPSETLIDAVVNLAGARVLGQPWTRVRRAELLRSRTATTAAVVDLMRRLQQRPSVLVSASAVGFYGASPQGLNITCDELAPARPGQFQSDLCTAIEHEARRAEVLGVRVVRMRFGVVLGRGGGAYPMQALASRLGLGVVLGSGSQDAPWIHLGDAVGLIGFALTQERLDGAVNAVAPDVRSQRAFMRAMAATFGRGIRLRVPHVTTRWLLGEMADLLLEGQRAVPVAALRAGYVFHFPTLEAAFADLAKVQSAHTSSRGVDEQSNHRTGLQ